MLLREYIYVDVDKVRGLVSQMSDGIPESAKTIERKEKDAQAKHSWIGGFGQRSIDEESVERSMGDSLFKILEEELESLGLLQDLSSEMSDPEVGPTVAKGLRPGSLVRITAPGTLFHPGQLSDAMVGIVTAAFGLSQVVSAGEGQDPLNLAKPRKGPPQRKTNDPKIGGPEDALLVFPEEIPLMEGITRSFIAGIIQFVRGSFSDGVHLQLRPQGIHGAIITARLEDGRRFMDSTPEVLFSRYGLGEQEWTVVGTVGQLGEVHDHNFESVAGEEGRMNRAAMVKVIETFLGIAGDVGLVDSPAPPGFSVVPLAVYRAVGWAGADPYLAIDAPV